MTRPYSSAAIIRWVSVGWFVFVLLVLLMLHAGPADWESYFDDAFLFGAIPGGLGLLLSQWAERSGK